MWSVQEWEWCGRGVGPWGRGRHPPGPLEADSYVIIPVNTPVQDLTQVALHRLGYPKDIASGAVGSVVIQNWKPLSFDQIAESPLMTVGDILGELSTIATLRIQIFRPRSNSISEDMKNKLFRLLLIQSHSRLMSTGCPLDESVLTQLLRPQSGTGSCQGPELNEEIRRKFNTWWAVQLRQQQQHSTQQQQQPQPQPQLHAHQPPWYSSPPSVHEADRKPSQEKQVHPAIQTVQNQYPTQKTRMRTSFDPELEVPKLQHWFCENQHPNRQQIQQYVKELNSLESRRGRKPLDISNVVYWFKNARAAQKRAEIRSLAPGLPLTLNGYNCNSQSPSDASAGLASKSPGSGHPEEEAEDGGGGASPQDDTAAPLSLTTGPPRSPPSVSRETASASPPDSTHVEGGIKQEVADSDPKCENNNENNNNNTKEENNEMYEEEDTEDMDDAMSESEESKEESKSEARGGGGGAVSELLQRSGHGAFPMVANSMLSHSIMYMSHYMPGLAAAAAAAAGGGGGPQQAAPTAPGPGLNLSALADERRKRNRTFIDPVSEVPRLEQWFADNTHPSHNLILKYTDDLNRMPYRQKFPPLEPKNVQFWFKNRRAKCKRLKMSLFEPPQPSSLGPANPSYHYHLSIPSALSDPYQSTKLEPQ
ncbi:hypothetical protein AAG570_002333 [Ranatra chinensis]|uniref:DNA-binding protein SATB2 n=1 Tax=Ranatra chinensis TaxID=642074 RepID=A0ABD0Y7Q2_9HEMI